MKVSLKWLAKYVDLRLPVPELARRLTLSTAEVEGVETVGGSWEHVRVGSVIAVTQHPNADRLRLATIDSGTGQQTVVCGAPNLAPGQKIAFAEVGAHLVDGHTGKPAVLKANTIRGVESAGMVCSERELGLSNEHEGILVLPTDAPVGAPLRDVLGDTILDLYSWPHRPDLMSMIGVAREVSALTGEAMHLPSLAYPELGPPADGRFAVDIEASDLCRRYVGALVEDVQISPSPSWMQECLVAAGMRPINNVVDITNYVMIETGQPLHAFDYDRIVDHHIVVRKAVSGELLTTLDGEQRELDDSMLVIADPSGPIALAGVMGGETSEVSGLTSRIFLEAATFDGITIRRTSGRLRLRSEASSRFEKGIGAEVAPLAARRATQLLVELCGGRAAAGLVDAYPNKTENGPILVADERIRAVLGVEIEAGIVDAALTALGFQVNRRGSDAYEVIAPYWRTDVHIADDVIEEIIRIVGYESIPLTTLKGAIPELISEPVYDLRNQVQDLLMAQGMQEVISYSLVSEKLLNAAQTDKRAEALRIVNPASLEHVVLRPSLRPSMFQCLAANARKQRGTLALFETARVYLPRQSELPREQEMVVGALMGRRLDRWGMPTDEEVDFYDLKGIVQGLLRALRIAADFRVASDPGLVQGRSAGIFLADRPAGVLGQVHPTVASQFELQEPVYVFEMDLGVLLASRGTTKGYKHYARFPAVQQDLALIVEREIPAERVAAIIRQGRFVREAQPFDIYTGPPIPEGHKSLAFAVHYQAENHTLNESEVARSREQTVQRLQRELGARLREG